MIKNLLFNIYIYEKKNVKYLLSTYRVDEVEAALHLKLLNVSLDDGARKVVDGEALPGEVAALAGEINTGVDGPSAAETNSRGAQAATNLKNLLALVLVELGVRRDVRLSSVPGFF
jgi:hypothetical protein